ncbi:hypothetical protein CEQ31_025950 [Serratia odorifera]|nr:hypothetical protein CEQ31_025950 [Serratia odorifera]
MLAARCADVARRQKLPHLASIAELQRRRFEFTTHGVFYMVRQNPLNIMVNLVYAIDVSSRIVSFLHQEFACLLPSRYHGVQRVLLLFLRFVPM